MKCVHGPLMHRRLIGELQYQGCEFNRSSRVGIWGMVGQLAAWLAGWAETGHRSCRESDQAYMRERKWESGAELTKVNCANSPV